MLPSRWIPYVFLLLVCLPTVTKAAMYAIPALNEAHSLVDISPTQAQALIKEYLQQRKLADKAEKTPSNVSREETDHRLRTPTSSVEALKILANAELALGNPVAALTALSEAQQLTQEHQLHFLDVDIQLESIRLHWLIDRDKALARNNLQQLITENELLNEHHRLSNQLNYQATMLLADIASFNHELEVANDLFQRAKLYLDNLNNQRATIEYHITLGSHYLRHQLYNLSLSALLNAYWGAIEANTSAELAKTNYLLAQLFHERRVLDKALIHLSQSTEFYGNYPQSPLLVSVLQRMGDIYFEQGKYNLALVHYFNALDHENNELNPKGVIDVRLSLAATYLELYNYTLAEQYLAVAKELLTVSPNRYSQVRASLLSAQLALSQHQTQSVIDAAQQALILSQSLTDKALQERAYHLLSLANEQQGHYAKALEWLKKGQQLAQHRQAQLNQISEDAFRQQKEFVEQTLHLVGQEKALQATQREYSKFQKIAFTLFLTSLVLFLYVMRRGYIIQTQQEEIDELNTRLFTHSRSQLPNLRMLNAKLLSSLQRSSNNYEQWLIGELIHEPLNDRLRFAMIDIPFLRNMYLQHGYSAGVELEHAFGQYLAQHIDEPTRLYHFSDANLLYIEPNIDRELAPELLFTKIQTLIDQFQPERRLNRIIRLGITDYPFLPRAYTAINDKELLDILLMATGVARELSLAEQTSHWVYLKAIDNAPAASFASNNMRKSCQQAIDQGLIKIHSSSSDEALIKKHLRNG